MRKDEHIKNLRNVKLIIGNGFDLYCGLKTSYYDFFAHDKDKNNYFLKWLNEFESKAYSFMGKSSNHLEFWNEFQNLNITNVWDFYFFLMSRNKDKEIQEWTWCDIETKIEESLSDVKKINKSKISWINIFSIIKNGATESDAIDEVLLASVTFKINNCNHFDSPDEFYMFLLNELKKFERDFANYIWSLHQDRYGMVTAQEQIYKEHSKLLMDKLCDVNNLISIDSFNYDWVGDERCDNLRYNINGYLDNPIFGIDSDVFDSGDTRFIFSKTSRRMEVDMFSDESIEKKKFDNIVIFGSSLSPADYSYFFSIFDKIAITDLMVDSKIVFAFSVYDQNKQIQISNQLRKNISNLFQEYSKYKGNDAHPNRLLDALTTQGKVILYEISSLNAINIFRY